MTEKIRDSFIFYRSFFETLQDLPRNQRLDLYEAIASYALNDEKIDLKGIPKTIFKLIEPQLEANRKRYENGKKGAEHGKKGGRPKKEETPKKPLDNPKGVFVETPNKNKNKNNNLNNNQELEPKPKPKGFIPPSLQDVQDYCKERNNSVNPEKWISHYQSNGWKVGKNSMKDWKAAVRTWEGNSFGVSSTSGDSKFSSYQHLRAK